MTSINLEKVEDAQGTNTNKPKGSCSCVTAMSICLSVVSIVLVVFLVTGFYVIITPKFEEIESGGRGINKRNTPSHYLLHETQPGLEAVKLVGQVSAVHLNKIEYIYPWVLENEVTWAELSDNNTSITILNNGLYFVYAQIYYFTNHTTNSFKIVKLVKRPKYYREGIDCDVLSYCASPAPRGAKTEVSCYTGVIAYLQANDRISLLQLQGDRLIQLEPGYSHWGVLKLQDIPDK